MRYLSLINTWGVTAAGGARSGGRPLRGARRRGGAEAALGGRPAGGAAAPSFPMRWGGTSPCPSSCEASWCHGRIAVEQSRHAGGVGAAMGGSGRSSRRPSSLSCASGTRARTELADRGPLGELSHVRPPPPSPRRRSSGAPAVAAPSSARQAVWSWSARCRGGPSAGVAHDDKGVVSGVPRRGRLRPVRLPVPRCGDFYGKMKRDVASRMA
jgi:hypothetical protein